MTTTIDSQPPQNNDSINSPQRWTACVDEEGLLTFPDDLLEQLGWKEGDEIKFIDRKDGSFYLEKINEAEV